jgi:hypothetical protein
MTATVFKPDVLRVVEVLKSYRVPNKAIAELVGSTEASVESRCSQLGIRCSTGYMRAQVGLKTEAAFTAEAELRGMEPHIFLARVLQTIACDDLFHAIIDDDNAVGR